MYVFLRYKKNRILLTIVFTFLCSLFLFDYDDLHSLREHVLEALRSITFVLAVVSALSLTLFNNYVVGLKDKYLLKVSEIRNRLEDLYDKFLSSESSKITKLNEEYIFPLVALSSREWLAFDTVNDLRSRSIELLESIHQENPHFISRYLLRVEDEINELGVLFVSRIVVGHYLNILKETFTLIAVGMSVIVLAYLLPISASFNLFIVLICMVVLLWAIVAILYIGGFLYNNGKAEEGELYVDENE